MNLCNFAKILIARSSKDSNAIDFYNNINKDDSTGSTTFIEKLNSLISLKQRHENYNIFTSKYPKLQVPSYTTFKNTCVKLQDYVTLDKYYSNRNANNERKKFIEHFSLQNFCKLPENGKSLHKLADCNECLTVHAEYSSLHTSYEKSANLHHLCNNIVENIENVTSPSTNVEAKGKKSVKLLLKVLQPVVENKYNIDFKKTVANTLSLTPKIPANEQKRTILKSVKTAQSEIQHSFQQNDNDLSHLLSSGKSFKQHDSDRMETCFIDRTLAEQAAKELHEKVASGHKKPKIHHGKFDSYIFDKDTFLDEIKNLTSGIVNWTRLARKYKIRCNGKIPGNAGQILQAFAKANGIDPFKYNKHRQLSGRDHVSRIRRSKKRIFKSKLSVPTLRTGKKLKEILRTKIASKEIDVGIPIAPKQVITNKIEAESGNLKKSITEVYGRKISLHEIIKSENARLHDSGVMRLRTDDEYDNMDTDNIIRHLQKLGHNSHGQTREQLIEMLKTSERTRKLKLWHDHSDILNHSHILFMVSFIYDTVNFLTSEEFKDLYPFKKAVNIQSIVEKPQLYIFGQSGIYNFT